jgi:ligand-binding sensor domain-containing protein
MNKYLLAMKNPFYLFINKPFIFLLLGLFMSINVYSQVSHETFLYKDFTLKNMQITPNDYNIGDKVFRDSKNRIWVYGSLGLKMYSNLNIVKSECINHLNKKLTYSICEDKKGNIFVGSNGTLYSYDGVTWTEKEIKVAGITAICCDDEGIIWLSCRNRGLSVNSTLFKYNGNDLTEVRSIDGVAINMTADSVNVMLSVQFFTGLSRTLQRCDNIFFISKDNTDYLKYTNLVDTFDFYNSLSVTAAFTDKKGNHWFGTKRTTTFDNPCVIRYFNVTDYKVYPNGNKIEFGGMITSIFEDNYNNIWIGTLNGLYKYSENNWKQYSKSDGLADNTIIGFTFYQELLYVYTGKGLTIFQNI